MNSRLEQVIHHPLQQHLGVTHIDSDDGKGSFTIEVSENVVNPAGVFHGGVLYMLADVCSYAGLLTKLNPDQEAVTHDIHVSVLRAANKGDQVKFDSQVLKLGKRIAFIDVTVTSNDHLLATARVTKSILPPK